MSGALIVSGGGFQGLGLLESLQCIPGLRPMIADVHADNVTRYQCAEYFVVPPLADADAFVAALRRLIEDNAVRAVFPATARELPLLAARRAELEAAGAKVAVSSPQLVEVLLDKQRTARFLADRGLPTQLPVDPSGHDFSSPLFGKPRFGWGGTGTVIAASQDQARTQQAARDEPLVWVPLVADFHEHSVDFALSRPGELSPLVIRRRIRTSGGYAVISESVEDTGLASLARDVAAAIAQAGGLGIFNIQLISPVGAPTFVSDVNPRFGTSAVHGLAEGVNLAAFFMGAADASSPPARRPAKTVRRLQTIALPRLAKPPAGVVFDLDDTLVDHKLWMMEKLQGAVAATAGWVDRDEFLLAAAQYVDEGERAHLIDRLAERFGWDQDRHAILLEAYRAARVPDTPVYPDVAPVLRSLREAGLKLAILTDNPPPTQQAKIRNAPALAAIPTVVYARETGAEKPHPGAFAAVAEALSIEPGRLCMVGDNYFRDALGALRSGYGCAFLLRRGGAFATHHEGTRRLVPADVEQGRVHAIDSLVALRETLLPA
ncbi:MAG TPA: HAD-IA family hydrolase [Xanthomonadaceae bacterium]|nr:HAD-IA family hydrolase [Xanthomonadaceae bacterium]